MHLYDNYNMQYTHTVLHISVYVCMYTSVGTLGSVLRGCIASSKYLMALGSAVTCCYCSVHFQWRLQSILHVNHCQHACTARWTRVQFAQHQLRSLGVPGTE